MKLNILKFNEFSKLYEAELSASEPVGLAILGAPAGGKSYTMDKFKEITDDSRIIRALDKGVTLTVDKLRDEFRSQNPEKQLLGFLKSFYLMKNKATSEPSEYGKWFEQIKNLWVTKMTKNLPELKITVDKNHIYFNGKKSLENIDDLKKVDASKAIGDLDDYEDYKRVVRYFQEVKQADAVEKTIDVSYDEAGDEPSKIVSNLDKLHKKGYVTDVFLIHPKNIASNIIQNYKRVVTGGDGGRDSSAAIVNAFIDIEKNKDIYQKNAEEIVKAKSDNIITTKDTLRKANIADDKERGDKPIDVLAEIEPMPPKEGYKKFYSELKPFQKPVFDALLRYAAQSLQSLPKDAHDVLLELTDHMDNTEALSILKDAAKSGKFQFKFGGVTDKLVDKAKDILK